MDLRIARFLGDPEQMIRYLARENIVPVKSPPWAEHPFGLRRNEKTQRGQPGRLLPAKMMPVVLDLLGVRDERTCRELRERIKRMHQALGYS